MSKEIKSGHSLETVLRIISKHNALLAEYIIRGDRVEAINYWPSGVIMSNGEMTLEDFYTEVERLCGLR